MPLRAKILLVSEASRVWVVLHRNVCERLFVKLINNHGSDLSSILFGFDRICQRFKIYINLGPQKTGKHNNLGPI